jgi:hypothetical protein
MFHVMDVDCSREFDEGVELIRLKEPIHQRQLRRINLNRQDVAAEDSGILRGFSIIQFLQRVGP